MGEIRFVGTGRSPYLVCKKNRIYHRSPMQTEKSQRVGNAGNEVYRVSGIIR